MNTLPLLQIIPQIATYFLSVSDEIEKPFSLMPLSGYTFRERILIHLADISFYSLIAAIGRTIRYEVVGWEHFEEIEAGNKIPIYSVIAASS